MSDFIATLRKLADSCDFKTVLNDMLRDRLVCGINNDLMQTRLLEDAELTFEKAVKVVVAMEAATKDSQAIACRAKTTSAVETNPLSEQSSKQSRCRHCGKSHGSAACRYDNMTCHNCKKVGHLSAICTARPYDESSSVKKDGKTARDYQSSPGRRSKKAPSAVVVHSLDDPNDQDSDNNPPTYNMWQLKASQVPPIIITVIIQGKPVDMELDTGAGRRRLRNGRKTLTRIVAGCEGCPLQCLS